jgi:hypothetical protein
LATSIWAMRFSRYSFCKPASENEFDTEAYVELASLTASERLAETLCAREVSTESTVESDALCDTEALVAEADSLARADSSCDCTAEADADADCTALAERAADALACSLATAETDALVSVDVLTSTEEPIEADSSCEAARLADALSEALAEAESSALACASPLSDACATLAADAVCASCDAAEALPLSAAAVAAFAADARLACDSCPLCDGATYSDCDCEADAPLSSSDSMLSELAESSSDAYTVLPGTTIPAPNTAPVAAAKPASDFLRFLPPCAFVPISRFLLFFMLRPIPKGSPDTLYAL